MSRFLIGLLCAFFINSANAQWQVPLGSVPTGRGAGVVGFGSASGASGLCLVSTGLTTPPTFQNCSANISYLPVLSIGTNIAPPTDAAFTVNKNAAALLPQSFPGETWMVRFAGVDGTAPVVSVEAFGSFPAFSCQRADGTGAAPTAVQAGELICALTGHARGTTGYFGGAGQLRFSATQNWTDTAQGTKSSIWTTPKNVTSAAGTAEVISFEDDGGVTVPSTVNGGSQGAGSINASGVIRSVVALAVLPVTVASLPTCNAGRKGYRAFVTDANATTFHSTAAGGGANNMGVTCDGTNWYLS